MKTTNIPDLDFKNLDGKAFDFEVFKLQSLGIGKRSGGQKPYRPHRIHYFAIMIITAGKGKHFIDFKAFDCEAGNLIFVSEEQVHAFQKKHNYEGYFLTFTEHFLDKSWLTTGLSQQFSLYNYQMYEPVVRPPKEVFDELVVVARKIHLEYENEDDFATEEIVRSCLKILLLRAERIRKKRVQGLANPTQIGEFKQFQQLLRKHLLQTRKVKFYANKLHFSSKKLNLICKEITNESVKSYINFCLILEIKRFLMNTDLSIKEIAYKTGFDEPTNFVKFFKKYTTNTPSEFRKSFLI